MKHLFYFCLTLFYSQTYLAIASASREPSLATLTSTSKTLPKQPTMDQVHDRVICIGDLHGNLHKASWLWTALEHKLGKRDLAAATIVFLGDYCDRGPDTKGVLDWLIQLKSQRAPGKTLFVAGNHDFGMMSYLGLVDTPRGFDLDSTRNTAYHSGFFAHEVPGGMHYTGRRWGGCDDYEAEDTFNSYGVDWHLADTVDGRQKFISTVPETHKNFLRELPWVQELSVSWSTKRLICVHAGLVTTLPGQAQLDALHTRDVSQGILQQSFGRIDAFHGRWDVEKPHPDLEDKALVISGHHGFKHIEPNRIIMDNSGGSPAPRATLDAIILPEREVVTSLDAPGALLAQTAYLKEHEPTPPPAPPRRRSSND